MRSSGQSCSCGVFAFTSGRTIRVSWVQYAALFPRWRIGLRIIRSLWPSRHDRHIEVKLMITVTNKITDESPAKATAAANSR